MPVYLVRVQARGLRLEKAWDKSLIPYPFARVTVKTSEPVYIDPALDRDELQAFSQQLNKQLDQLGD